MTREQIEAHIGRLESIALTNWASPLDREAVDFAITRLRADLDAMPVGETRRVNIEIAESPHVANRFFVSILRDGEEPDGDAIAVIVADIPVRQVPVVKGVVR